MLMVIAQASASASASWLIGREGGTDDWNRAESLRAESAHLSLASVPPKVRDDP